jgi:hypothetical protein
MKERSNHMSLFEKTVFGAACLLMAVNSLHAQTNQTVATSTNSPSPQASAPPDVEKAMQMPDGKDKNAALGAAIKAWAKQDPTAGLAWALTLPPGPFGQVRGNASAFVQGADPKSSADWLVQQSSSKAFDFLHPMLVNWAQTDPTAAEAWCVQLQSKDTHARDISFFSVADGVCRKKPELAAAWVAQLQPGADRISAVGGTALLWARGNIVAATAWVKTLDLPAQKWAAQTITSAWGGVKGTKDAPNTWQSAQEWLNQLPLSPSDKEYVLKNPRRG